MSELPYFSILNKIPKYFERIREAETPADRFSISFIKSTLNFSSSNDQRLISVLKAMEFIDDSGHPLRLYRDFRSETLPKSKAVAQGIKNAYAALYARNVNVHECADDEIKGHVIAITDEKEDSDVVRLITKSFSALVNLAEFQSEENSPLTESEKQNLPAVQSSTNNKFNLTHTIVLNLPTTTTKEVYDAIFKSLKENLG